MKVTERLEIVICEEGFALITTEDGESHGLLVRTDEFDALLLALLRLKRDQLLVESPSQ